MVNSMDRREPGQPAGFTLVELLVVITILLVLLGLLMPILGLAQRESRKSATRTVMVKVDTALRLFRSEIGPYPYQTKYADFAAGEAWTNRLYYHLGTDISDEDRDKVVADADAAGAIYTTGNPPTSPHAYKQGDTWDTIGQAIGHDICNMMAEERVRLAVYSGHPKITSGVLSVPYYKVRRVLPTTPLLAAPASEARPGWAKDYLKGELPRRHVSGDAILDAWNRPIIYVCQVVEGMISAPRGFIGYVNAYYSGLHPLGRRTLAERDTITDQPLAIGPGLTDLANLRHSDRRLWAPRGLEVEFELWSAGPDGLADWMRDAAANLDNVPLQAYDRNIP